MKYKLLIEGNQIMKIKYFFLFALMALSVNCFAEPAKKETIDAFFDAANMQKMMNTIYGQMDGMFKHMTAGMNVPEKDKPIMDKYLAKYTAMVKEEMSWDKLKEPMEKIYASVYTEDEMQGIVAFYKSPAGQKMLNKMPELMQASNGIMQDSVKSIMPKIQALQKEMSDELAQAKKEEPKKEEPSAPAK
jgi:hypothetical protein